MSKILFVVQTKSFLITTIAGSLEKSGHQVVTCSYGEDNIETVCSYDTILLFVENDTFELYENSIIRLGEIAQEGQKNFFLLGEREYTDALSEIIGMDRIKGTFLKPLNVKEITTNVAASFEYGCNDEDEQKSILVIDDSGTFLHTIKSWLGTKYAVSLVNSAAMGFNFLGKNKPDLILLDCEMPECSGPEMFEKMKVDETLADIPVIFLTGKGDRESITKMLELKPAGYLLKSMPKEKIVSVIDDFFSGKS